MTASTARCPKHVGGARHDYSCHACMSMVLDDLRARPSWDRDAVRKRLQSLHDIVAAQGLANLAGTSTGVEVAQGLLQVLTAIDQYGVAEAAGHSTTIVTQHHDVLGELITTTFPAEGASRSDDDSVVEADGTTSVAPNGKILDPTQAIALDLTKVTAPARDDEGKAIPPAELPMASAEDLVGSMMKVTNIIGSLLRVEEFVRMSIHMSRALLVERALVDERATIKAVTKALAGLDADHLWHDVFSEFLEGWYYVKAWTAPLGLIEPAKPPSMDINDKRRQYMQRLIEHEVWKPRPNGRVFSNFSSAGAGKTVAALTAGLRGAELLGTVTVHVLCKPTQARFAWIPQIDRYTTACWDERSKTFHDPSGLIDVQMPDSKRAWKPAATVRIRIDHYDALSTKKAAKRIERWMDSDPGIKLLILDEAQRVGAAGYSSSRRRRRTEGMDESRGGRHGAIRNPRIRQYAKAVLDAGGAIHAMTATPAKTTPDEVWDLLETLDGVDRHRPDERITVLRCVAAHVDLHANGLRVNYDPGIKAEITDIAVDHDLYEETIEQIESRREDGKGFSAVPYESLYIGPKLEAVEHLIEPGTVLFLNNIGGDAGGTTILDTVLDFVRNKLGLSAGTYVGCDQHQTNDERCTNLVDFVNEALDVLVASDAITEGTDGLQARCHTLIQLISPWHSAGQTQLIARFARSGAVAKKIEVYRPYITFENQKTGDPWSWCRLMRLDRIDGRAAMCDLIMDGTRCGDMNAATFEQAKGGAFKLLTNIDSFALPGQRPAPAELDDTRPDAVLTDEERTQRDHARTRFQKLQGLVRQRSARSVHELIGNDPDLWEEYMAHVRSSRDRQLVDPIDLAVRKLLMMMRPGDVVADFGAGTGALAEHLATRYPSASVVGLDHHEDLAKGIRRENFCTTTSLADHYADFVTMVTVLGWGRRKDLFEGAFPEVRRVLKAHGRLIVVERDRVLAHDTLDGLRDVLAELGFVLVDEAHVHYDTERNGVIPTYAVITAVVS